MTIQQLEYVVALDTYRHFVTAANKCFVTQPTITLQVRKLEDEIGVQIFDRTKTPLQVTAAGELIVMKARSILQEVNQLKQMVNDEKESLKGDFKVGIIPTIAPYIIPSFYGDFVHKYPDTHLDIEEMQSERIIEQLSKGDLDIGILVTPLDESNLREVPLYNEPFCFYGDAGKASESAISKKEVEKMEGLWLLSSGHCFRSQVLNICQPKDEHQVNFRSGSIETLKSMVNHYGGFTLIPELASDKNDPYPALRFDDPQPTREVSIVVHKGFVKEALLDAIRESVLTVIPKAFDKNDKFFRVKWR